MHTFSLQENLIDLENSEIRNELEVENQILDERKTRFC